jgi:serine/threonine protein kinase
MAPEQLLAQEITPAADLFSWASTMVYAATGQSPFGQDTVMAVIHRIINEPPDLGTMEEPLRGIVADCLAKDPAERPNTQALLMRLLGEEGLTPTAPMAADPQIAIMDQGAAFAGTTPQAAVPTAPTGLTKEAGSGASRTPSVRAAMAALAGLLVAVAVVAVIWAASRGGDHPSGGSVQTPAPSSAPPTSSEPDQPAPPIHRRQTSSAPTDSGRPEPSTSVSTTQPGGGTTQPGGGTTQPGGGGTTQPGSGTSDPGSGAGGGVPTQPAAEATR